MSKVADLTNSGDIMIQFPYDPELVEFVKSSIPGRRWDAGHRIWRCPISSLPEVIDLLEPKGFFVTSRLKDKRQEAEENSVRASGRKAQGEIHDIAVRERGEELVIIQGKSGMT